MIKTKKTFELALRTFLISTVKCCKAALKIGLNEKKVGNLILQENLYSKIDAMFIINILVLSMKSTTSS